MKFHVLSANDRFSSLINMSNMSRNTRPYNSKLGVPWDIQDCIRALVVVAIVAATAVTILWFISRDDSPLKPSVITIALITPHFAMVIATWIYGIRKYNTGWNSIGFSRPIQRWAMLLPWPVIIASIATSGIYFAIVSSTGMDFLIPRRVPPEIIGNGSHLILNIFLISLAGPMIEELFFRGFILSSLVQTLGPFKAIIISSFIFSASHLAIGVLIPFFITGMMLAWLYLKTRSLWPPFIAHSMQNLLALMAALYAN